MRWFFAFLSLSFLLFNSYFFFFRSDPLTQTKIRSFSLSRGDHYFAVLKLWYLLADTGDWSAAALLESKLDPADIKNYQLKNSPTELKKRQNILTAKTDKNVEDWLELARIQIRLNNIIPAINSLNQAKTLDPVRDDIDKMISELKN